MTSSSHPQPCHFFTQPRPLSPPHHRLRLNEIPDIIRLIAHIRVEVDLYIMATWLATASFRLLFGWCVHTFLPERIDTWYLDERSWCSGGIRVDDVDVRAVGVELGSLISVGMGWSVNGV